MLKRHHKTEALILKASPYGEGHTIVTALTSGGAQLKAMAYGSRKLTSRIGGHLNPLTRVELALYKSRDMDIIKQAQNIESFSELKNDLSRMTKAFFVMELIEGFSNTGVGNRPLFDLSLISLRGLQASSNRDIEDLTVSCFQLNLLKVTGFMPELYTCVECRSSLNGDNYNFIIDIGGLCCTKCLNSHPGRAINISYKSVEILRQFDQGGTLFSELPLGSTEELRRLLDSSTGFWLDREIRSRRFMEHMNSRDIREPMSAIDTESV